MRRLLGGIVIGLVIGVAGTLVVQRMLAKRLDPEAGRSVHLFQSAPGVVERALPGARVLDVVLHNPSTRSVNYIHDVLYDVEITYERERTIKRVRLPFGFAGESLIVPSTSDIVIADDKAQVIETLGGVQGSR